MEILLQQIINGLVSGSMYALVALGYTMVYGIINLINFAHGEVLMVGALTSWAIITNAQEAMPGPARVAAAAGGAGDLVRGRGGAELRHREDRLPAAAQQPQAGAADHRPSACRSCCRRWR
jgi:branched-subunit amino acid ABC-type transport system permease component